MNIERQECLIIEYVSLPQEMKDFLSKREAFRNDIHLEHISELSPIGGTWDKTCTIEEIKNYHKDQIDTNGYKGNLNEFISEYKLTFDKFLIDNNVDFTGIKTILIKICW